VGNALLPLLLHSRPERKIFVLTRSPEIARCLANYNVTPIQGDLTQDNLGLTQSVIESIKESVTEVIHCAADTRFRRSLEQARASNLEGTARLLSLASQCKDLRRFAHVSTVYVTGRDPGLAKEERLTNCHGFLNAYQQSKYEAEQIVFDAMPTIPATIYRLSSIVSDSLGHVRQHNYFHQILKLALWSPFPMIPGEGSAPLDLIASDWAASALAALFEHYFSPGTVHHICAGAAASMTVRETLDWTFQLFNKRRNCQLVPPELVTLEEFDTYATNHLARGNGAAGGLLQVIKDFLPQLAIRQCFENRETLNYLSHAGLRYPPIREYYPRLVENSLKGLPT